MPVRITYIEEDERLDLSFEGTLDVTLVPDVCHICRRADAGLRACILDLNAVDRIYDFGLALLQMLYRRLKALGASVVIISDRPEIRAYVPVITRPPLPAPEAAAM
jgi:anti-anti-sigma regulatory factor